MAATPCVVEHAFEHILTPELAAHAVGLLSGQYDVCCVLQLWSVQAEWHWLLTCLQSVALSCVMVHLRLPVLVMCRMYCIAYHRMGCWFPPVTTVLGS